LSSAKVSPYIQQGSLPMYAKKNYKGNKRLTVAMRPTLKKVSCRCTERDDLHSCEDFGSKQAVVASSQEPNAQTSHSDAAHAPEPRPRSPATRRTRIVFVFVCMGWEGDRLQTFVSSGSRQKSSTHDAPAGLRLMCALLS
jgi:hypothetical protein